MTPSGTPGDHPVIELQASEALSGTKKTMVIGDRIVTVNIPPGVKDGTLLRLPGQGDRPDVVARVRIAAPEPLPRSRSRIRDLIIVGVVVLIAGVVIFVTTGEEEPYVPVAVATSTPSPRPRPSTTMWQPPASAPTATSSFQTDPFSSVQARDCLRNYGSASDPHMLAAACTPGTYRILARKSGTVDQSACDPVDGTTHDYVVKLYDVWYRHGIEVSRSLNLARSYVFCLQAIG